MDDPEFVDIPTMYAMTDDEYREYVRNAMLFVDHHEVLRVFSGIPLATTLEQLNILIRELDVEFYKKLLPRLSIEKGL